MGEVLLLPMNLHKNESSMANITYSSEFAKIAGVYIKMDTSKEKIINVHIKNRNIIYLKACAEGLFYTNLDDPSILTIPTNVSINAYSYLSTIRKNSILN